MLYLYHAINALVARYVKVYYNLTRMYGVSLVYYNFSPFFLDSLDGCRLEP